MTQVERSIILKKICKWLVTREKGETTSAIHHQVKWEITEGGATDKIIKKYIEDLHKGGHIVYKHPFWRVSKAGKRWLERHII